MNEYELKAKIDLLRQEQVNQKVLDVLVELAKQHNLVVERVEHLEVDVDRIENHLHDKFGERP